MNTRAAFLSTLPWLFTVGACGGAGQEQDEAAASEPPQRIEACSLLTRDEIESALGKSVGEEPFRSERDGFDSSGTSLVTVCNWEAGGLMDGVSVTVRQFTQQGEPSTSEAYASSAREDHERQKADPEQAPYVPNIRFASVDMAPHSAVLMDWGDYVVVQVYQGGRVGVQVSVSAPSAEVAEALSRMAASRLPE